MAGETTFSYLTCLLHGIIVLPLVVLSKLIQDFRITVYE